MKNGETYVKIDGYKLKKALLQRGITFASAGRRIGYSDSFISTCCMLGKIRKKLIGDIWNELGVPFDEYEYIEEEEAPQETPESPQETPESPQEAPTAQAPALTKNDLYDTIYMAMRHALADSQSDLYNMMSGAMKKGMIEYWKGYTEAKEQKRARK